MNELDPRQVFDPELRALRAIRAQGQRLEGIEKRGAPSSVVATPATAHAASHEEGGSDPITPASIGAAPDVHASQHHTGGSDPLAPGDIGAAAATHSSQHHTGGADALAPSDIGAAAATHSSQHHTGGSDALTPSDIGAAAATHSSQHHTGGADALAPADIGAEATSHKGAASGYAGLDADARLPLIELPLALQRREVTHFKRSTPGSGECLMDIIVGTDCDFKLPAGLTGSFFKASVAAYGSTVFTLKKNTIAVATCTFAPGGTVATFTAAADILLTGGDRLQLFAPAPDATLADLAWNFLGTRLDPGTGYVVAVTWLSALTADSPAMFLRLNETSGTTAADASGNSRVGTYVGSPTLGVTGLQSDGNKAAEFTGSNRIDLTPSDLSGLSDWTFECLAKRTATGGTYQRLCYFTGSGLGQFSAYLDTGVLNIYVRNGSQTRNLTCPFAFSVGTTYHVAAVCKPSTGEMTLYINGTAVATLADLAVTFSTAAGVVASLGGDTYGSNFVGVLDEFAMYGSGLSSTRVAAHYGAI